MAAWTSDDVILVAPELNTTPAIDPATFAYFITLAEGMISADLFGTVYAQAGALLTAHLMIRTGYGKNGTGAAGMGAAVGAISSMSVGSVSVGFAQGGGNLTSAGAAEFGTTRQGSLFWELVELKVIPISIADDCTPGVL